MAEAAAGDVHVDAARQAGLLAVVREVLIHGDIGYGDTARLYTTVADAVADAVAEAAVTSGYLVSSPYAPSMTNSRRCRARSSGRYR